MRKVYPVPGRFDVEAVILDSDEIVINQKKAARLVWDIYESFGVEDAPQSWRALAKMLGVKIE